MAGRRSAALEEALRLYKPGVNVYALAAQVGIAASTLYRVLPASVKRKTKRIKRLQANNGRKA